MVQPVGFSASGRQRAESAGLNRAAKARGNFCADVAGYTRLMNADEAATLRLLASHREMTDRLIHTAVGSPTPPETAYWPSSRVQLMRCNARSGSRSGLQPCTRRFLRSVGFCFGSDW